MEFAATQIYEDDDLSSTQKIACTSEEEELAHVSIYCILNRISSN